MQRHIGPELLADPSAHGRELFVRVVVARDQQGGELQPDLGFVLEVEQGVEYGLQVRAGELEVKVFGERLQVHIGGVHLGEKFPPRQLMDVARRDRHGLKTQRVAGVGRVHGVLGKNHRVVVGKGHTLAAMIARRLGDGFRRGLVHQAVHVVRLADVPVLAELAGQVAARRAKGKHAAAGVEVVERLFLDRVDAETG